MNWYYTIDGRSQGPLTENGLKRLAREGTISGDTLVWHQGLEEWEPMSKLKPEIAEQAAKGAVAHPPEVKAASNPPPPQALPQAPGAFKRLFRWGRKTP